MTDIAEVETLSRWFGTKQTLANVSYRAGKGLVYGLVGVNGAGKTTLIKHLLGLLRARSGSVRIFGKDPARHPVEVLQEVGYLSEERDLPDWMTMAQLLTFTEAHYPTWDGTYAQELIDTFGLDPNNRIKDLSKGMRAQAGLIAAVAHRPQLLILDEPSSGLDAVVREDILNAVLRAVSEDGRTVIFSSHLLDEVERARIRDGIWTDRETIWKADIDTYNSSPDIIAGGRLAFDSAGHFFLSVGMRSTRESVQDLSLPYGKIHRVRDDGGIPADNPFAEGAASAMPSIGTIGHRSPQGLEFDRTTHLLCGSEMGPRGGDELNLLRRGANYGWPLVSRGVNYDGTPVDGQELGDEFVAVGELTSPVVDFSPSPSVSSLVVYRGDVFPNFRGDILLGSLKAGTLYRVALDESA